MSVSMKDRKAVIYGEVERLRALLDQREQQIATQAETIARRDAQIGALSATRDLLVSQVAEHEERKAKSARPAPAAEDREVTLSKIEIGKRLAILMKRSVRNAQGGGFESYVDGEWVAVPERVVRYACNGGAA